MYRPWDSRSILCAKEWRGDRGLRRGVAGEAAPRAVRRFRSNLPAGMDEFIAPVEIESCIGFE